MNASLIAQRYALALSILNTPASRQITLSDLDEDQDFDPLDALISQQAGKHCSSIAFYDDDQKSTPRALLYEVRTEAYNGRYDADEDGATADTESIREIIRIDVHAEMTINQISDAATKLVREISNNRFA